MASGSPSPLDNLDAGLDEPRVAVGTSCEVNSASCSLGIRTQSGICDDGDRGSPEQLATANFDDAVLPDAGYCKVQLRPSPRRQDIRHKAVQGRGQHVDEVPLVRPTLEVRGGPMGGQRPRRAQQQRFQHGQSTATAALLLTIGSFVLSPTNESVDQLAQALGNYETPSGDSNERRVDFERASVGRPSGGGSGGERPLSEPPKVQLNGARRRAVHELGRAAAALEAEVETYEGPCSNAGTSSRRGADAKAVAEGGPP